MMTHVSVSEYGKPVRPHHVRKVLHQVIARIGLESDLHDTHLLRIGHCCDLMRDGVKIEKIKFVGRWASNAVFNNLKRVNL